MGWNYAMNWLVVLPFELTTAGITIAFWNDSINVGVWITIFLVAICAINIFGIKGYGEVEFFLGCIKVIAIIGFIILGIIIDCGGVPTDNRGYIGFAYWGTPGAFRNGFKGFCSVFVTASFSFGGTELVGLAAAEAANPRKTLPKATKQVFWRITLFYVISLLLLGLIVPSDDSRLTQASGGNTKYSPFVLSFQIAGIKALPSIFNAVITLSVLSVANSCSFASTRTIQALCASGMGPKIGARVDKHGRPYIALIVVLLFGLLAYINEASSGSTIFTWLLALSGLSNFFTWGSICYAHIRFRSSWKQQGRSLDELPFTASMFPFPFPPLVPCTFTRSSLGGAYNLKTNHSFFSQCSAYSAPGSASSSTSSASSRNSTSRCSQSAKTRTRKSFSNPILPRPLCYSSGSDG